MQASFNNNHYTRDSLVCIRCIIDLTTKDLAASETPYRNLESLLGGFARSFQILAEHTVSSAYTPENSLIINTGTFTASNVITGLRTFFPA
jgi:aldehyde:ferredoxin oxidoreductase